MALLASLPSFCPQPQCEQKYTVQNLSAGSKAMHQDRDYWLACEQHPGGLDIDGFGGRCPSVLAGMIPCNNHAPSLKQGDAHLAGL